MNLYVVTHAHRHATLRAGDVVAQSSLPTGGIALVRMADGSIHALTDQQGQVVHYEPCEGAGKAYEWDHATLLRQLEDMARQHCHTDRAGGSATDSGGIGANADALRTLAKHRRFRIVRECGRMVVGYWPEHEPIKEVERDE
jgi:hypothetical protein